MELRVEPGVWVVAVSGGVDSVVLLDMLQRQRHYNGKPITYVVAHFDHGIRSESANDRRFVQQLADKYGLPFVYEQAQLGSHTSEATARAKRYEFLEKVRQSTGARGLITAHHLDDALETAIHNIIRGTGRRGMTALKSTSDIQRPLLHISKQQIKDYARSRGLRWHEDATNADVKYLRNYIRHRLLQRFPSGKRAQLAILIDDMRAVNDELDNAIAGLLHTQPHHHVLDRKWFIMLPHDVAREVVYAWLRAHDIQNLDRKTIERLVQAIKVGKAKQVFSIDSRWNMVVGSQLVTLEPRRTRK